MYIYPLGRGSRVNGILSLYCISSYSSVLAGGVRAFVLSKSAMMPQTIRYKDSPKNNWGRVLALLSFILVIFST